MSIFVPFNPSLISTPVVGLESIQRNVFFALFEGLNNAIAEVEAYWVARDAEFDRVTGRTTSPVAIERVDPANFHEGHKPSLISNLPSNYPNIAVFGERADPTQATDVTDAWMDSITIETMIKGPDGDEDTTNRRVHRMAESIVLCLRRNPSLGGSVFGRDEEISVAISDLFRISSPSQSGGYPGQWNQGDSFLWQGAQIGFRIRKDSALPESGPGTFSQASQVEYSQYIDQG